MDDILAALAFAALIGAQFLAVIVVSSNKAAIYADPHDPVGGQRSNSGESGRDVVGDAGSAASFGQAPRCLARRPRANYGPCS